MLFALAVPANAQAYFSLVADGVHIRGTIRLIAYGDPSMVRTVISERGRVIAERPLEKAAVDPEHGQLYATVVDAPWKCTRRTRSFTAVGYRADGTSERGAFTVRTPSCANRLTLRARPGRVTVTDSFERGGVTAQLCARVCRQVVLPDGTPVRSFAVRSRRGDMVTLRTRYQRVRLRIGARSKGGATILATGDSLMQNLEVVLADRLRRRARVVPDLRFGAGLASEGLHGPWADIARAQVARLRPRATVVFLGTNDIYDIGDLKCCGPAWEAEYERRARAAMKIYAQGGSGAVVWLTVPFNRDERRHAAERAVNAALRRAAAGLPTVALVPADDIFTPGGLYRPSIDGVRVREPDGIHLSLAGSRIAARHVIAALRELGALGDPVTRPGDARAVQPQRRGVDPRFGVKHAVEGP